MPAKPKIVTDAPEWARRIRGWRESCKLSQTGLARKLGVFPSNVSKWESAISEPLPRMYAKLAALSSGDDKGFFLEKAGLAQIWDGSPKTEAVYQTNSGSEPGGAGVLASKTIAPVPPHRTAAAVTWDPELLAFVIERVNLELEKRKKKLPHAKYAEMIVLVYEFCLQTGRRDLEVVSRMLKIA